MEKYIKLSDVIKLIDDDIESCTLCLNSPNETKILRFVHSGHKIGLKLLKYKLQKNS